MKLTTFLVATIATGLASAASLREFQIEERTAQAAAPVDPAPFRLERPGRVFHNATPRGVVEKVGGSKFCSLSILTLSFFSSMPLVPWARRPPTQRPDHGRFDYGVVLASEDLGGVIGRMEWNCLRKSRAGVWNNGLRSGSDWTYKRWNETRGDCEI